MTFGEKLKVLRIKNSLSQEQLAQKLSISRQAVSKWEQDAVLPDMYNLVQISKMFHVSLDELMNNDVSLKYHQPEKVVVNPAPAIDDNKKKEEEQKKIYKSFKKTTLYSILVAIIVTVSIGLFFLAGFLDPGPAEPFALIPDMPPFDINGWIYSWTFLLLIPCGLTLVKAVVLKKYSIFFFPIIPIIVYLYLCLQHGNWLLSMLVFLLIPVYYIVVSAVDKVLANKKQKKEDDVELID